MRLHILSDLHLEFEALKIPTTAADVVILAGDLHIGDQGLDWIKRTFPDQPVVYVLGNHEYYHHALPELTERLQRETAGTNIHVLENSSFEFRGFTILGCCLWTSFRVGGDSESAMRTAEALMNDYRIIRNSTEQRVLRGCDTVCLHEESVQWLREQFARHDPARTVVVTHHAPSCRSEAPQHLNSPLHPAFTSDLNALIEASGVPLWINGHTHHNVDYRIGQTRVLSNQRGYPGEHCKGFDPALVVRI